MGIPRDETNVVEDDDSSLPSKAELNDVGALFSTPCVFLA
jgi:hypothetical protein